MAITSLQEIYIILCVMDMFHRIALRVDVGAPCDETIKFPHSEFRKLLAFPPSIYL